MAIYVYRPDVNHFEGLLLPWKEGDKLISAHYQDQHLASRWHPIALMAIDDEVKPAGDCPGFAGYNCVPIMAERAWNAMQPLIGYCCEDLPVIHPNGRPHYFVHVTETLDILDERRSHVSCSSDRITWVYKYAFKSEIPAHSHIFKLPRHRGGELIVDDEFRRVFEESGLTGLVFKELPMVD